jgi:hypothetical protein
MDAKTLDLALLAALSLFCAMFAWAVLARSFLRSVQSRLSAQPMGSGVEGNARGCDGGVRKELATRVRHF